MARPIYVSTLQTADTGATSALIGGGITAGTGVVAVIDTTGKLTALNSTYVAPITVQTAGKVLRANGTSYIASTFLIQDAQGGTGSMLRSSGTQWVETTFIMADTWAINTIPYASSANTLNAIAPAANSILASNGSNVPAWTTTIPSGTQDNITRLGTVTVGVWNASVIGPTYGGTGVNNGSFNLTVPATGTAALLGTANVFTANVQTFTAQNASADILQLQGRASDNQAYVEFTSNNGGTNYGYLGFGSTFVQLNAASTSALNLSSAGATANIATGGVTRQTWSVGGVTLGRTRTVSTSDVSFFTGIVSGGTLFISYGDTGSSTAAAAVFNVAAGGSGTQVAFNFGASTPGYTVTITSGEIFVRVSSGSYTMTCKFIGS